MSQNIELAKVKAKIKALAAVTFSNGAFENEVIKAMETVGKLLAQYNLSMHDLDLTDEPCVHEMIQSKSKKMSVAGYALGALGRFTDCIVWTNRWRSKEGVQYHFFGLESDVAMAKYLYELIETMARSEVIRFKLTETYKTSTVRRSASVSFINGIKHRMRERFNELKQINDKDREEEAKKRRQFDLNTRALTLVKEDIVKEAYNKQVGIKLRTMSNPTRVRNRAAYNAGTAAGNRINLNRPINGDDEMRLLK